MTFAHLLPEPPAPFDWDAHNAKMDAGMAALKVALDRWHETERALDNAHLSLVGDLRVVLAPALAHPRLPARLGDEGVL